MADLAMGRYPRTDAMWKVLGQPTNLAQPSQAARSNAWAFKLSTVSDGALAATEVGLVVAVPVQEGDAFSKVTLLIGGTASKEVEAGFAALYEGKAKPEGAALLAQSKTAKFAASIKAGEAFTWELEKEVLVNSTNCPNGYLWAMIALEAKAETGAMPTAVSVAIPKACQYSWFSTTPECFVGTTGAGLKTTAPATLEAVTSAAVAPLVFLR